MKYYIFFLLLFCTTISFAQEISETLIIDQEVNFCQPGVLNKSPGKGLLLDYRVTPNFTFNNNEVSTSTVENNLQFNSKLKIPIIIKPGFKLLIGFQYMVEQYNFDENDVVNYSLFNSMDGTNLRTSRASFYISKPINAKIYTSFRLGVSYTGDYNTFLTNEDRYATYRAVGVLGIKKREDLEYGFGIMYSKNFRNVNKYPIPFLFINQTYDDKWGIEFAIPISMKVRRNLNDGSLLLFGPQFNSRSYSLDVTSANEEGVDIFHFRRAAVETTLTFQQRIKSWVWMEANVGYNYNLKTKVNNTTTNIESKLMQSNGVYGSIGIFLSPPRKNKVCEEEHK